MTPEIPHMVPQALIMGPGRPHMVPGSLNMTSGTPSMAQGALHMVPKPPNIAPEISHRVPKALNMVLGNISFPSYGSTILKDGSRNSSYGTTEPNYGSRTP